MEISKLFGLPAHPLIVHVPIVLLPMVGAGGIAIALVPPWRKRFGWVLVALAGLALVGVQLAIGSGEALEDHVAHGPILDRHTDMAASLRPLALLLFLALVGLMLLDGRRNIRRPNDAAQLRWVMPMFSAFVVLMSVVTTVRLAQIGHNGARASWHEVNLDARHGEGDGDD